MTEYLEFMRLGSINSELVLIHEDPLSEETKKLISENDLQIKKGKFNWFGVGECSTIYTTTINSLAKKGWELAFITNQGTIDTTSDGVYGETHNIYIFKRTK